MERLDEFCYAIYKRFLGLELDNTLVMYIIDSICTRFNLHTNHSSSKNKSFYDKDDNLIGNIELCNYIILTKHDEDYILGDNSEFKYYILHEGNHNAIYVLKINKKYL